LSGLTAQTLHYFGAYATYVDGEGSATQLSEDEYSFWTLSTEPTTHVGFISITNATTNSVTLAYSAATGANRYGVITATSDTPVNPALIEDGKHILEQSVTGTKQETTGTSLTRSTLQPNTTYSTSVFPMNRGSNNATTNYLTTGEVSTITFRLAPTTQASAISLGGAIGNSATITWTNGNGAARIVKINSVNSFTNPTLGSYPTSNNAWQNAGEQVVYNGSGNSVTVSGLTGGNVYWVRVYELNNMAQGRALYITTTATNNPNSFEMPYPVPETQDSGITFSNVSSNSMTATWTKGDGTGRIVKMNTSNSFANPANNTSYTPDNSWNNSGEQVVYNGTGNTVDVTDLAENVVYYFRIYSYNGGTGKETYNSETATNNPNSQKTLGEPSEQHHSIVFSEITGTSFTFSWTKGDGDFSLVGINTGSITQPLNGNIYTVNSVWQNSGSQYIYKGTGNEVTVTNLSPVTNYTVRVFAYNGEDDPYYLTSTALNNPVTQSTHLTAPSLQASSITFPAVGNQSMTISWTSGNGTGSVLKINTDDTFAEPVKNQFFTPNTEWQNDGEQTIYTGSETSVTVTNLDSLTIYYYRVYEYNSGGEFISYNTNTATNNPNSQPSGGQVLWDGGTSGSWHTASNWVQNIVPSIGNRVIIAESSNAATVSQDVTCKSMVIQPNGRLTVSEEVTLSVLGNLDIGGDSNGSGSLVIEGTGGSAGTVNVTGTSSFKRHTGITSDWHLASVPTNNNKINQFNGYFVNLWTESTNSWLNLNSSSTLQIMQGYSIKTSTSQMATFTGTFNSGGQSIGVTNGDIDNEDRGWNMIGNPYPSAIDWGSEDGWSRADIESTVHIYNASAGSYITYNYSTGIGVPLGTTGIIPAGNGYYIRSTAANTILSHDNRVRRHSGQAFYKSGNFTDYHALRLSISNGSATDEAAILFHYLATDEFNPTLDSRKLFSVRDENPQIYVHRAGQNAKLTVASFNNALLEFGNKNQIEIPIGFINQKASPVIFWLNENTLGEDYQVYIRVNSTMVEFLLNEPFEYHAPEGKHDDLLTIVIRSKQNPLNVETNTKESIEIFSNSNTVFVYSKEPVYGTLRIYDIAGREVYSEQLNGVSQHSVRNIAGSGIMVATIQTSVSLVTQKVFIE
jgi:hypothetical protein